MEKKCDKLVYNIIYLAMNSVKLKDKNSDALNNF